MGTAAIQKGQRNTKQKSLILDCLKKNVHKHTSVDDVYDILKDCDCKVGRATIYRYLAQLENSGVVKKYSFLGKKSACFRYLDEKSKCREHYHLMCDICGKVRHVENEDLQLALDKLQQEHNFLINDTKTMFYGSCIGCADEK